MKYSKESKKSRLSEDALSEVADKVAVTEDDFSTAVDKSREYADKELDDELERLADTFRREMEKAKAMSEEELVKNGIVIQQYEDDDGAIPEEELCQCCGERRRDRSFGESYEYCGECREAMKRYPLSIPTVVTFAAMVFIAVVSIFSFAADYSNYNTVRQGDRYIKENKIYSAIESYDTAIAAFTEEKTVPKRLCLKSCDLKCFSMPDGVYSMMEIKESIETALSEFEIQLPMYARYEEMYREMQILYGTMNEFYNILNNEEYSSYDFETEEQYEEIMTEIGAVIDKQVTVTSVDKKTSELVAADEAMVRFCQYMFAYTNEKYEDSYKYMNLVYELKPSYLWLYAYELGMAEIQNGNLEKAEKLAKALYESNYELPDSYALYSSASRMQGDFTGAVEWAEKGISVSSGSAELYRLKGMAYMATGDFESAEEALDTALEQEGYGLLYMTAMVAENELGNKTAVKDLESKLEENDIELSEKMTEYFNGKITAQEVFTKGTGDVE